LTADRPFLDNRFGSEIQRFTQDQYLFRGPGTYIPRVEETVNKKVEAIVVS